MIDEAILRPGRLEVHVEVSLPDQKGREQIYDIHLGKMKTNNMLEDGILSSDLATRSVNYTGAEIESVVRNATNNRLFKEIDVTDLNKKIDYDKILVSMNDFDKALTEIMPVFGTDLGQFSGNVGNLLECSSFDNIYNKSSNIIEQLKCSEHVFSKSILIYGSRLTGKTTIASKIAIDSHIPLVRMINGDSLLG